MMHRPTIERDWPEDFAHENGNYENTCVVCGRLFLGHKRRIVCKVCTHAPSSSSPEGMVLVPVEPTREMLLAAKDEIVRRGPAETYMADVWKAMLAASPARQGVDGPSSA